MHRCLQGAEDVGVGVIAYGAGEDPADTYIGEVQGAGELPFEGRTTVRDGIAFEEPRRFLNVAVAVRIVTEDRNNGEALVVDFPVIWSRALTGRR